MRLLSLTIVTVLLATSIGSAQSSGAALLELEKQFAAAMDAGDAKKLSMFYADDAINVNPGAPLIRGRAAIDADLQAMVSSMKKNGEKVTTTRQRGEISGDLGFVEGEYLNVSKRPSGEVVERRGTFLDLWKRVNGEWKIIYSTFSQYRPPTPDKPQEKK